LRVRSTVRTQQPRADAISESGRPPPDRVSSCRCFR
jgi:hypothetical protein